MNNVNGVDGDPGGRGDGRDLHTLAQPALTRLQERYVERVADEVRDLPYVLYEIANESPGTSRKWQEHLVRHLREHERLRGRRHPIGMTFAFPGGSNDDLFRGPADWISPGRRGGYMTDPPPADGRKVVIVDTDHLWGIGGGRAWVWRSFLAGLHPIYMDPLDDDPTRQEARQALGQTLALARRLDLARALPAPRLASSRACLAQSGDGSGGGSRVAYFPQGRGWIDLSGLAGEIHLAWLAPTAGTWREGGSIEAGRKARLRAPFPGDAVAWLSPVSPPARAPAPPAEPAPGGRSRG